MEVQVTLQINLTMREEAFASAPEVLQFAVAFVREDSIHFSQQEEIQASAIA